MPIYALVDCNNFYASCERVFNPKLNGKPIVILSNNDGCVIARSNEAKALGIPMGAPFFQWEKFCKQHSVKIFSSNYELYGDISNRVMATLRHFCPDIEIYSIDEAFLNLDGFSHLNLNEFVKNIRKKVKQWTGIPVSIGFGPSKTLAKVANKIAKNQTKEGFYNLTSKELQDQILASFPIEDIWGIGNRLAKRLNNLDIKTAKQLRDSDEKFIRSHFSVVMERMIRELRGIACLPLEEIQPKKQIMSSRSFGKLVTQYDQLAEAISYHTANACVKLRKQDSLAQGIYVFVETNIFKLNEPQYGNHISYFFPNATDDTGAIISIAKKCLKTIFKEKYRYHKAGIMLLELLPNHMQQLSLFSDNIDLKRSKLMKTVDKINSLMGKETIFYCAEGIKQNWHIKRQFKSPCYTTRIDEVFTAFC